MLDQLFDPEYLNVLRAKNALMPQCSHRADLFNLSDRPWDWLRNLHECLLRSQGHQFGDVMKGAVVLEDDGPVYIEDTAVIQPGAMIRGPAYIGMNVTIGHGALVTGSLILEGCVIGHATQVKSSIFFPRSRAPHLNYVGDSVVGLGVNLGAGVKTANAPIDDLQALCGISVEWGAQKIDTGMKKIGAIVGDSTRIGCNCVLNPGTIIGMDCRIYGPVAVGGWIPPAHRVRPEINLKITPQRPRN